MCVEVYGRLADADTHNVQVPHGGVLILQHPIEHSHDSQISEGVSGKLCVKPLHLNNTLFSILTFSILTLYRIEDIIP